MSAQPQATLHLRQVPRTRHRYRAWLLAAVAFVLTVLLLRQQPSPLEQWMTDMRARGAKFTREELGLRLTSRYSPVLEELAHAAEAFSPLQTVPNLQPSQAGPDLSFHQQVRWLQPVLYSCRNKTHDWNDLETRADSLGAAITDLHGALQAIPSDPGLGYGADYYRTVRHSIHLRAVAQDLHTLTLVELHRHNFDAAHSNLVCLIRLSRVLEYQYSLVCQAIRSVLVGLAQEAVWEALQAPAWTDDQLAEWQTNLGAAAVLPSMPQTLAVERCNLDLAIQEWLTRGPEQFLEQRSGSQPGAMPSRLQARLAHTFVRTFRASQDRLRHLQYWQSLIEAHESLLQGTPGHTLNFNPPLKRLWSDPIIAILDSTGLLFPFSQPPNFSRLAESLSLNETRRLMSMTAIALERHRLRHGRWPATLTHLVPQYLETVPRDPWHQEALTYKPQELNPTFLLYARSKDGSTNDPLYAWPQPTTTTTASREVIHTISFESAPSLDAIQTLARQAGITVTLHPSLQTHDLQPLTMRWKDVTAIQALEAVVQQSHLRLKPLSTNTLCLVP